MRCSANPPSAVRVSARQIEDEGRDGGGAFVVGVNIGFRVRDHAERQALGSTCLARSGRCKLSESLLALCLFSGATMTTSAHVPELLEELSELAVREPVVVGERGA